MNEQAFFDALNEFDRPAQVGATAATVDVCGTYKKVKPILQGILPILNAIPNFGHKVASAIQALMAGLDSFCGISTPTASLSASVAGASDAAFFQALAEFHPGGAAIAPSVTAASLDLCATYKKVKPILHAIIPFLSLIPGIGAGVGAAITALTSALDAICQG